MSTKISLGQVRKLVRERIVAANSMKLAEMIDPGHAAQRIFDLVSMTTRNRSNLPSLLGFMRSAGVSDEGIAMMRKAIMSGDADYAVDVASSIVKREIFFE